jgi:glutamine amidotransferase
MLRVVVLDYGSGNLRSAERALARVGAQVSVSSDPNAARDADGLVVPGVGAFAACMAGLRDVSAGSIIADRLAAHRPVLGICVGMQVLFEAGIEHGVETDGLGILPGRVEPLDAPILPHMGWNTVAAVPGSTLFAGIADTTRFYFVHSYAVLARDRTALDARRADGAHRVGAVGITRHGEDFVAAIEAGVVSATQFHPEKSGDAGATVLENWLRSL